MNLRQLLEKRANLISQARAIVDAAEGEDRGLTDEENQQYGTLMDEASKLSERIQRMQALEGFERDLAQVPNEPNRPDPDEGSNPGGGNGQERQAIEFGSRGLRSLNERDGGWLERPEWSRLAECTEDDYRASFREWLRGETRALQVSSDTAGGYLVLPLQMVDQIIQAVDNLVFIRQWASVFSVPNADSLGVPSLDNDPADPTWTSELLIGSEDSTMSFGRRELSPSPLAQYIKVSRKMIRQVPSSEDLVTRRLAYKLAVVEENAFLNGDGAGEPLGVFTASAHGINTGQDASTGNTTTEIRFDGLIECKYTLKMQYWPRARWVFHRDGVKMIAKLKDGEGQYIWRESTRQGEPDRCLGFPVFMSEYAPNTFTTGLYVGILGDFSNYWIADALDMEIQRLVELYAATNQIGFVSRLECDGMPVLEEAFARVTLA